jgi:putative pyruvate formate lyase activating enzyme
MNRNIPSYLNLIQDGVLAERAKAAADHLQDCTLCPRKCGVNRLAGETGVCKTGTRAWVSSYSPHFGEEAPLVGSGGSGTVFFTHCNLLCSFCQNFDISHEGFGQKVTDTQLAALMLELQKAGCHNINFVTPSHVVPQILKAIEIAAAEGLRIPLVYNTGGYDRVTTLKLLEGIFDIFMPDFKFWSSEIAEKTCDAADYPAIARKALMEMHRQVGDLQIDASGIAIKGLLIRHLVMPGGLAGTRDVMRFIAKELSTDSYVNIMNQYRPCGRAAEFPDLATYPSTADFKEAVNAARQQGLHRLDRPRRVFMLH